MRTRFELTGTIPDTISVESIITLLESSGVTGIKAKTLPEFEDWLASLPSESVPELRNECLDWIHSWGCGGGDYSTDTCITTALTDMTSDIPAELAKAVYSSVSDYSKSDFGAMELAIKMVNACLPQCTDIKISSTT